jgi:hypothetical protein
MLTNSITVLHELTGHDPATLNAWSIVALGLGAFLAHAYHTVVNAGGLKRLWSNFWNGPLNGNNTSPPK